MMGEQIAETGDTDTVTITTQPVDTTVLVSTSFTLTVVAESDDETATLSYQWQVKDGDTYEDISGATSSTYTALTGTAGTEMYRVVITSDKGGTATSDDVTVSIVATDTITITQQPVGATVYIQSAPYPFYLEAESNIEGATLSYQWYYWINNQWGSMANATTNPYNYTATSTPETRKFRCRVTSDLGGEVYSEEFEMVYVAIPFVGQQFKIHQNQASGYYMTDTPDANGGFGRTNSIDDAGVWEFTSDNKIKLSGTDTYIETDSDNNIKLGNTGDTFIYSSVTYARDNDYWKCYIMNSDNTRCLCYIGSGGYYGFKYSTTKTYSRIHLVPTEDE